MVNIIHIIDTNILLGSFFLNDAFHDVSLEIIYKYRPYSTITALKEAKLIIREKVIEAIAFIMQEYKEEIERKSKNIQINEENADPKIRSIVKYILKIFDGKLEKLPILFIEIDTILNDEIDAKIKSFKFLSLPSDKESRKRQIRHLLQSIGDLLSCLKDTNDVRIIQEVIIGECDELPMHSGRVFYTGDKEFYRIADKIAKKIDATIFIPIEIKLLTPSVVKHPKSIINP